MRKIIQICVMPDSDRAHAALYALCDDNTLWCRSTYNEKEWVKLVEIPQDKKLDLSCKIYDLNLMTITINALKSGSIFTVADLVKRTESDLSKIKNLGKKSLHQIKLVLSEHNLFLRGDLNE